MIVESILGTLIDGLGRDVAKSIIEDKNESLDVINDEAIKRNISLKIAQQQARVAQDIAIALRIVTADNVEIEEYYDKTKEENAGLNVKQDGVSLGLGASGRDITKRVYKFKGYNEKNIEIYEQSFKNMLNDKKDTNDPK